ncbi:MAG: FkbM family methyltransferase [Bacteroidota bacterium]
MNKLLTYSRYFFDYMKHGDLGSVIASVKYKINKTSHNKDRIIRTSVGMFFCRKNTNDFQFANYYYEWGVKKFVLDHIKEYDVFIDAGACVGNYSILLSNKDIRCIAFEPVKNNYEVLVKNLELNHLTDKVDAFPFGLGKTNSIVDFFFNPVNTGASHISDDKSQKGCLSEIRTFDSLFPDLKICTQDRIFFKIDVEGMEADAIKGTASFIKNFPNLTFILEDKHSGKDILMQTLNVHAVFEYGIVDEFNFYARKVRNLD